MQSASVYEYHGNLKYDYHEEQLKRARVRREEKAPLYNAKQKGRILMLTFACGLIGIAIIIASAFAASLQHDINALTAENHELQTEISEMNMAFQSECNIVALEETARTKLGMVYPSASQIVYVDNTDTSKDFKATAKEQVYN